jgi:F-box and WD-40 domain protein 1/11
MLPIEIVFLVFKNLDILSLSSASCVSKNWNHAAAAPVVWRAVFLREFTPNQNDNAYLKIGGDGVGVGERRRVPQEWKKMALARREVERNWTAAKPKAMYFSGHTDSVYCCQFDEEKIITGSRDRTIRVWDINNYKCLRVIGGPNVRPTRAIPAEARLDEVPATVLRIDSINGTPEGDSIYETPEQYHDASILCLQYDDEIMVTGSSDFTCIVWDIKTFQPLGRLHHHTAGVLDICFDKRWIVSCSKDATICVWDRQTAQLLATFKDHKGPVNAIQMRGHLLVSASGDGTSKLWNLKTLSLVRNFVSKDRGLAAVEFSDDGKYVLAGGNDMVIYKYDAETTQLVHIYRGHHGLVRSLFVDCHNRRVLSGSYDQGIRVYDFDTGNQLGIYENWTTSWILSAKSDYRRIVATSQDGRVLMMDFGWGVPDVNRLRGYEIRCDRCHKYDCGTTGIPCYLERTCPVTITRIDSSMVV